MSEQQQATNGQSEWESKYKELQAEFTRKSQQLAEIEKMRSDGKLLEKDAYDEWLINWAKEKPEEALQVFPTLKQHLLGSGQDSIGSKVQPSSSAGSAFDDAIFDQSSEAYQKFVREHGEKGYRQALMSRMAPELLEQTGLGKELTELREFKQGLETELAELREQVAKSERYAISSYDAVQIAQDPRRKQIREIQEKLTSDPNYWYEVAARVNGAQAAATPEVPAVKEPEVPAQQTQAPSPEQLAKRIDQASVVPQGAGSGSGQVPSQAIDPFDAAVAKADPILAQRMGIPTAA